MNIQMVHIDKFEMANGKLTLQLDWRGAWMSLQFYGGPYNEYPGAPVFGVCVRSERTDGFTKDVHVPIVDFKIPTDEMRPIMLSGLKKTFQAALDGKDIWIGCMGGMGRTGLFMAILAKAAGVPNPVEFVRENYYEHAVETPPQYKYVTDFDVTELQSWLRWECWKRYLKGLIGWK